MEGTSGPRDNLRGMTTVLVVALVLVALLVMVFWFDRHYTAMLRLLGEQDTTGLRLFGQQFGDLINGQRTLQKDVTKLQEQADKQREGVENILREVLLTGVHQAVEQAITRALASRTVLPEGPKVRSFVILAINDGSCTCIVRVIP